MLYEKKDKEISEKDLEQISSQAGGMIRMFEEKITDPNRRLALVSALAGYACHRAVMKEPDMTLIMVETKDDRTFYYGDDLNFFLLENKYSVYSFVKGYYDNAPGRSGEIERQRTLGHAAGVHEHRTAAGDGDRIGGAAVFDPISEN